MIAHFGSQGAAARAHEEFLAYWASRRVGGARLPPRSAIHPSHFKRHLPYVSLIDVRRDPRTYRLRLAGTGLYPVYGREITGRTLDEIYNTAAAEYWRQQLDEVVERARPSVGVHDFAWRGAPHLSVLWLRLPLASNGRDVDMILGYDAPVGGSSDRLSSGIRAA